MQLRSPIGRRPVRTGFPLLVLVMLAGGGVSRGDLYDGFEGPEPRWRFVGGDAAHRIERHGRTRETKRTGDWSEHVRFSAGGGTNLYLGYELPPSHLIDELAPSLWLKADRPGAQLLVQVVLPHTRDPETGQPVRLLLRGTSYQRAGGWEQLRAVELPRQLMIEERHLRSRLGAGVDVREAFVDQILLNLYAGPGRMDVWIDDLESTGVVAARGVALAAHQTAPTGASGAAAQASRIELQGSMLMVDGRPMFPRMIEYRGEPLGYLRDRGFNAVRLAAPADVALLNEAAQTGMWLVAPPPLPLTAEVDAGAPRSDQALGPLHDRVLVWMLGEQLADADLPNIRRIAAGVREADRRGARPLACQADASLRSYSRLLDLLVLRRDVLGTSLELTDFGAWVRERPRLARPGAPIWMNVETQPNAARVAQQRQLGGGAGAPEESLAYEQIRLMLYQALAGGVRGACFESRTRLDADDPTTHARAAALELLNLELQLLEPWLAEGNIIATAQTNQPEVTAPIFSTDRARLLLPIWSQPGAQFAPGQSAGNGVTFVVPGVPESHTAYEMNPAALEPLGRTRVTGGIRLTLDEFGLTSTILMTGDPGVIGSVQSRLHRLAPRAAQLQRALAAYKLATVAQVEQQLGAAAPANRQIGPWFTAGQAAARLSDARLAGGDYPAAYREASRAMRQLRLVERDRWEAAATSLGSPVASPFAVGYSTLPAHWGLVAHVRSLGAQPNRLPAGGLENLDEMLATGWRHVQYSAEGIASSAELSAEAARSGRFGLRLRAWAKNPQAAPAIVESTPVWITSGGVAVNQGDWIKIHGWVQVPRSIVGSLDGLMIIDSCAGESMAERIGQTDGWREFTLYRAATETAPATVSFALTGIGEAWIDDVSIELIPPPQSWSHPQARR